MKKQKQNKINDLFYKQWTFKSKDELFNDFNFYVNIIEFLL